MMVIKIALVSALGTLASPSVPLQTSATATSGDLEKSAHKVAKSLSQVHKATLADVLGQAEVTTRYDIKVNQCDISWGQKTVTAMYQDGRHVMTSTQDLTSRFGFEQIERIDQRQKVEEGNQVFIVQFALTDTPADQPHFKLSMTMTAPGSDFDQPPMEANEKAGRVAVYFNEQKAADRAYAALSGHHVLCADR